MSDSGGRMAVDSEKSFSEEKVWSLCKMPFWQSNNASSSSSTSSSLQSVHQQSQSHQVLQSSNAVSFVTKSLLPTRRRLHLDPPNKLYFPCKAFIFSFPFPFHSWFSLFEDFLMWLSGFWMIYWFRLCSLALFDDFLIWVFFIPSL